jgi:16S rRNA (cytidine1402-2'-O)-methyltransferase
MSAGTLYLVPNTLDLGTLDAGGATPDLQHTLPLEAIRVAAALTHWVAENAKTTRAFLKRVNAVVPLSQPLQSIQIVELPRAPKGRPGAAPVDLTPLLAPAAQGHDIGLISEAGLPAVADPGAALVMAAHRRGIRVLPLSGPSALLLALAASGLNGQSFAFVGYVPSDAPAQAQRLKELESQSQRLGQTQILIETPYRNASLLRAMLQGLAPATWLSVSCGLTLERGWTRTAQISQWQREPSELPADVPAVFCLLKTDGPR